MLKPMPSLFPFTLMKRSMSGKTEPRSVFKASGLSGLNTTYTLWTELNPADDHGVQAQWAHSLRSKVTDHLVCHGQYFKVLHFTCGQVHVSINRCHISCFLTVLISHDLGNPKIYCKLQCISAGYSVSYHWHQSYTVCFSQWANPWSRDVFEYMNYMKMKILKSPSQALIT